MKTRLKTAPTALTHRKNGENESDPVFQNSPLPTWVFDVHSLRFLAVNQAAIDAYGYSRDEFLEMGLPGLAEDVHLPAAGPRSSSKHASGRDAWVPIRITARDGSLLDQHALIQPIEYEGHKAFLATMLQGDESVLTGGYFAALLDATPDCMVIVDDRGHIVLVNRQLEQRFGYSREELLGKPVEVLLPQRFRTRHRTHRAGFFGEPRPRPMGAGRSLQAVAKDGTEFSVEISLSPLETRRGPLVIAAIRDTRTVEDVTERMGIDRALRESEDSYKLLFEAAPIGIALTDLQGNILAFNDAILQPGGYTREDILGIGNVAALYADPTQRARILALLDEHGYVLKHAVRFRCKDGSSYDARLSLTRLDIQGKPRLQAIVEDMTEQRAAEQALERSESLYRDLFNNALEGMFRTTPDGRFLAANRALVQMLGYKREDELLPLNVRDLYVDPGMRVHNLGRLMQTGELRDFEIHLRRKDGSTLIALENSRAIHDDRGEVFRYEGTLTDITERKLMEEALRVSEDELRSLFEAIPDLVLVLDRSGRYLRIGPGHEDMLFLPPEQMVGRTMHEIFSKPKADEFLGYVTSALQSQKPVHFEYALLIGSQIRWFSGAAAPLADDQVVWVARDVTSQKQVEEQVQLRLLELEALYESGLALGKTLDPSEISRKVIEVLSNRLHWHHAAVRVRRGDTDDVELLAFSEAPGEAASAEGQALARNAIARIGQGMAGWVLRHGRIINCGYLPADPRYHETFPNMFSGLHVPIWAGGRVLGCISVESHQRDAFTEADERLLTTLASQAAAALENARLFAETQQRVSESLALYEFTRDLTAQYDLAALLRTLAERIASLLNVPGGAVYLFDTQRSELEIVMSTDGSLPAGTRLRLGEGMAGKVAESREPLVVADYREWEERPPQFVDRSWAAVVEVPMLYRGELIGVMAAYESHPSDPSAPSPSRRFGEEDVRLLSLFAGSAAGAIYSTRLFDQERLRREEAETLRTAAVRAAERLSSLHAATREIARISQDPEDVYGYIHQAAAHLLPIDAFTIALVDEKREKVHGAYLFDRDGRTPSMVIPYADSFTSRVIQAGETLLIKDVEAVDLKRTHFGGSEHVRSVLAVPLRVGGQVIGTLSAQNYLPDVYQPEDQVLLEMLGAQAAIAIQNARLYQQALRLAERQAVLHHVSQSLTRISQDPEQLYAAIHAAAAQLMPADAFTIALLDSASGELEGVYAIDRGKRWPTVRFPVDAGYSGWVLQHRETLLLADARSAQIASIVQFSNDGDTRSVLMVPLQVGEKTVGAMSVQSYETDQYTAEDQAILELLGSQAAIAIQNAGLFAETSRRAEEFRTLYETSAAMSALQDMDSLLGLTVSSAALLLHSSRGGVYLYDARNNDLVSVARHGLDAKPQVRLKLGEGAAGRVALARMPLIIDDYSQWDGRSQQYEGIPFRAVLQVPMVYSGELIGVLTVDEYGSENTRKFTEADARLLSLFATQAAAAIYNARLLEDTRRRLHELESLAKVGDALTGTLELGPLLENILRTARQAIPAAEKGTILLSDTEGRGSLRVRAQVGYSDPRIPERPFDDTKGYSGRAFHEKRPILVSDASAEYEMPFDRQLDEVTAVRSSIVVPLVVKDEAIGAIALDNASRTSAFDEADLRLLVLFASSAAVVIENARLFEETRRRAQEFEVLYDATRDLSSNEGDVSILLSAMVEKAARLLEAYGSAMYLYDPARGDLELAVASRLHDGMGARIAMGDGAAGRVAQTRQPILIPDYAKWEGRRSLLEGVPYRAVLQVPMLYGGELIGVLEVYEYGESERRFSEADVKLLSLFGSQAAAAVHSARLFEETRKKAAQFASLYETARDLSGERNVTQLLETIVERAGTLLNAPVSGVYLYDKSRNDIYIAVNQGLHESIGVRLPLGVGAAGRVALERQPLIIEDYQAWEGRAPQYEGVPLRSVLQVPMLYSGELIGVLTVDEIGSSERKFTSEDADLLALFASYAAGAVHTARLFEQVSRRASEFQALYQTAADISSQTDLQSLLSTVIQRTCKLLGAAGSDAYLLDLDTQDLVLVATNDPEHSRGNRLALGEGLAGHVAQQKRPIMVPNYQVWEGRSPRYEGIPFTSALGIPMLYGGQLIGVLTAYNLAGSDPVGPEAGFSEQEASLLELLANEAAGAVYVARLLEQTRRRVEQLSALHAVDTAIGSTTDLRVSLRAVLDSVIRQLGVDAADVLLLNPASLVLQYTAGSGFFTSEITRTAMSIGSARAGRAALERQMIQVPDLSLEEAGFSRPALVAAERFKAYVAMPLITKGEVKGVLEVFQRAPLDLDEERRSLLELLAGQAALAIDNAQLFEGLEKANLELTMAYDATIEGWSQALELRDQETQGHSSRVLELTLRLATALGLPDHQLREIRRGVLLHDIGKMGIPDAILHKPGPLTPEEWDIMRQHPQYAYDMLAPIIYLRNSLDIPYCHHEKWDGTGYPRGLKAETIPLAARIFCVVDVYDALTSNRPYRGAWSEPRTLEYIEQQSGKHFDPHVVEAFLKLVHSASD